GRLRARRVQGVADGRGTAARSRGRWLWLPAPDGSVGAADQLTAPAPDMRDTGRRQAGARPDRGWASWAPAWRGPGREPGRPARGGAGTGAVAVAACARRLGGRRGSARRPGAGHAGYRMTAGGGLPERVLVVWCPGWPEAGQEAGTAGDDAGPGGGAAPGA